MKKIHIQFYSTFVKDLKHRSDDEFQKHCLENGLGWECITGSFDEKSFKEYLDYLKDYMDTQHGDTYLQSNIQWMIWIKFNRIDDNGEEDDDTNGNCFFWYPQTVRWEGLYKSIPMIHTMFNTFRETEELV